MSVEVFTSFIFRVILQNTLSIYFFYSLYFFHSIANVYIVVQYEIAAAADVAVRLYKEETLEDDQSQEGILVAMRLGTKEKTTKLIQKLGKLTAVANPNLGSEWLQEVWSPCHCPLNFYSPIVIQFF